MDLSVIIPTYNRLGLLREAVASCRGTACETEVLVVDDGSTDGTWDWLQTQPDVTPLRQPNWGKGWAVNRAVAQARGAYVRFLDSDDVVLPGANDAQVALGHETGAEVVAAHYTEIDADGLPGRTWPFVPHDDFIAQQLGELDDSHYSAYLFRRNLAERVPHRPDYHKVDDRLFKIEVALEEPSVALYDAPALGHRSHDGPRVQGEGGLALAVSHYQRHAAYRRCLRILADAGRLTPVRRRAAARKLWPLAHWIASMSPAEGAAVAEWVYDLDPAFVPPDPGALGWLYRRAGFRRTEQIGRLARPVLSRLRR